MALLIALWASKPLRWAVAAFIALGSYEGWKLHQRNIGAESARVQITKANDNAIALGKSGADKSGVVGVRGKRDPTTRNDAAN